MIEVRQQVHAMNTKLDNLTAVAGANTAAIKDLQKETLRVDTTLREHTGKRGITLDQWQQEVNALQNNVTFWGKNSQSQLSENMDIIIHELKKLAETVNSHTDSVTRDNRISSVQELGYILRRECQGIVPATTATLENKLKKIQNSVTLVQSAQDRLRLKLDQFQGWTKNRLSIAEIDVTEDPPVQAQRSNEAEPSISAAARARQTSPPRPSSSTVARAKEMADRYLVSTRPRSPRPHTPPMTSDRLLYTRDDYSGGMSSDDETLYEPPSPRYTPTSPKYTPTSPSYKPGDFSESSDEDVKPPRTEPPRKKRKGNPNGIRTRSAAASEAATCQDPAPVPAPDQQPDPAILDEVDEENDSWLVESIAHLVALVVINIRLRRQQRQHGRNRQGG